MIAACFAGTFILMLLTYQIDSLIELSSEQERAYCFMTNIKESLKLKTQAAILIQNFYRHYRSG